MNEDTRGVIFNLALLVSHEVTENRKKMFFQSAQKAQDSIAENFWYYCLIKTAEYPHDLMRALGKQFDSESIFVEDTLQVGFEYVRKFIKDVPTPLKEEYNKYLDDYYKKEEEEWRKDGNNVV